MSLNLSKLEKVRHLVNGGVEARCPACAEEGGDRKGEHLLIKADGRFGCCAHANDREHRQRIFTLAGDTGPRSIQVRTPAVKVAGAVIQSGVLGRLGRVFASPAKAATTPDASDGVGGVWQERAEVRTPRTGETKSVETGQQESRTLRTPQYSYTCGEKNQRGDMRIEIQGVPVGASAPSGSFPAAPSAVESARVVRGVRLPYLTADGTLVIPFDSPERFHWWKGGQKPSATRAEVEAWMREGAGKESNAAEV
jgi:hypothetical protein